MNLANCVVPIGLCYVFIFKFMSIIIAFLHLQYKEVSFRKCMLILIHIKLKYLKTLLRQMLLKNKINNQ